MNRKLLKKQVGILILACLMCLLVLNGCRKKTVEEPGNATTPSLTNVPKVTPTSTPSPTPTPTPIPEPWESYEKLGKKAVYRVPVKEFTEDVRVESGSYAGEYVLLKLLEKEPDDDTAQWQRLILLKPALSGDAVVFCPDYYIMSCKVLADGTVFLEDSHTGTVHVFDASFNEITAVVPKEDAAVSLLTVTDDGHIWTFDETAKAICVCDRKGENTVVYDTSQFGNVYQDLGETNGKRFFLAFDSEDYASDVIISVEMATGAVTEVNEKVLNVSTGEDPDYYGTVANTVYDYSNETWYLHLIAGNGHKIAFPHHYQYETVNCFDDDRICVSGYIWGENGSEHSWVKPGGCRVYDLGERTVLGELTTLDIEPYNSLFFAGMQDNGLVYLVAGNADDTGKSELLLWNLNAGEPSPLEGYFDLSEESPKECFDRLNAEYRDTYGVVYSPVKMKTIEYDEEIEILDRIDFLNRLVRGIQTNPEEFPKDADGISLRLENVRGHEHGHSEFNPHIFSDMSRSFYGEEYEKAFYNLVDAIRAGEDTFEAPERIMYNWGVARFATWYYPITTKCISTDYNYYDREEWKAGRGLIRYTVPKEDTADMIREFEQLICDTLDDCIGDDYTDFEKALALYEYITTNWKYDYDMYDHIDDYEWSSKGSVYRCLKEHLGICWEIAGVYEYLLLQCGINAEDAEGTETKNNELHAWAYVQLDGEGYNVDPTWGLSHESAPELRYFLFTDKERAERDCFPFDTCFLLGTDEMGREEHGILADDEKYAPLWDGYYIGMDRTLKKVIYEDTDGVLHTFDYSAK